MDIKLINYEEQHLKFLEYWKNSGQLLDFKEDVDKSRLYMIKNEGKISGCFWLEELPSSKTEALLGIFLGDVDYSSAGFGQYTVKLVLHKIFNEFNYARISVHVPNKNKKAVNFFKKCGFRTTNQEIMTVSRSKYKRKI